MFKVISFFTDKQDNGFAYHEGDSFPREGLTVSKERLAELSSDKNRRGKPVIVEVKEKKKNVDADMPRDSELVRQGTAENKRKNTNRKRTNNTKRVSVKDTK
jgi:hypothetical protein